MKIFLIVTVTPVNGYKRIWLEFIINYKFVFIDLYKIKIVL